jgi:hypothetical protein
MLPEKKLFIGLCSFHLQLRLVVIIINGCLGRMVSYINTLPVYSLIARGLHLAETAGKNSVILVLPLADLCH